MRNPKCGGQVILMWRAHGFKALLQESSNAFPYSYWALTSLRVPHRGWARLSFGPMDTDLSGPLVLGLSGLVFCFKPLQQWYRKIGRGEVIGWVRINFKKMYIRPYLVGIF